MKMHSTVLLILASAAALPAASAVASEPEQIVIATRDIDLATPRGVDEFDARIRSAIREACPSPVTIVARERSRVFSCRQDLAAELAPHRELLIARANEHAQQLASVRQ
jgi:UrcA family protein